MLVETGYAGMRMKGIAERAGVGRQTVYRWWSTKAEIKLEACITDARDELTSSAAADACADLVGYLKALTEFLTTSPAGLAYRALLGEAQHDSAVRDIVSKADLLYSTTLSVIDRIRPRMPAMPPARLACAQLTGPIVAVILETGEPLPSDHIAAHARTLSNAWSTAPEDLH